MIRVFLFSFLLIKSMVATASLHVGIGRADITPPIGSPSAGYHERKGEGMQGVHDPLLATALMIDTEEKLLVLCSVDHLGFPYDMVQEITKRIHEQKELQKCELYIASSHTHSGGGGFLDIPDLGESLAGTYDPKLVALYIEKTVEAIKSAYANRIPAKIGIGYGKADGLSRYRSLCPKKVSPLSDVAVIKITKPDNTPLAVLFNYPVHPTVLSSKNRLFSADFVKYARDSIQSLLGPKVEALYFNGAQGDIVPTIFNANDDFESCKQLGNSLANSVKAIWDETTVSDVLLLKTQKLSYEFIPQATPFGLTIPTISSYKSELNLLILNEVHAFLTIPGELSCLYDKRLKELGMQLGYAHVSIFGLVNDAHGYIILPESWRAKTMESRLSFGGEEYGDDMEKRAISLLKTSAPQENNK